MMSEKHDDDDEAEAADAAAAFVARMAKSQPFHLHGQHLTPLASDACFDEPDGLLIGRSEAIALSKLQTSLLATFIASQDWFLRPAVLAEQVADTVGYIPADHTVENQIGALRVQLATVSQHVHIRARRGFGYRLVIDQATVQARTLLTRTARKKPDQHPHRAP